MKISETVLNRFAACRVIPVITIRDIETALPLAEALVAADMDVLEITLRTDCALDALETIASADLPALTGAGTIVSEDHVTQASGAGADFLVTPGVSPNLLTALQAYKGPVFPGAASVSEALALCEAGFTAQKFFPAEAAGGARFLKSIAAPIPHIQFMPTGGISPDNAADYLALPNVLAVGGSWMVPQKLIDERDWKGITELARTARALR